MTVCGDHRDPLVKPLLLHVHHLFNRFELHIDFAVRAAGPVFAVLSHRDPHPVNAACVNGGQINFAVRSFLKLSSKLCVIIPGLYGLIIKAVLIKDLSVPVHYGSADVCRNTDAGAVRLGVHIETGLNNIRLIICKSICQRIERAVIACVIRELADFYVAHVRSTAARLQGHHQLVVHIRIRIGAEGYVDRLVGILLIPLLNHLAVEFIVGIHEGPHFKMCAVFRSDRCHCLRFFRRIIRHHRNRHRCNKSRCHQYAEPSFIHVSSLL